MENKKSNNNIILIVIGLILVAGVSLFVGMNIGNSNKNNDTNISENTEQDNNENKEEVVELDEVTALTLVEYLYYDAKELYDYREAFFGCVFRTKTNTCIDINMLGKWVEITNYDEIMNKTFTSEGKKQFENFTGKNIKKEDNSTYLIAFETIYNGIGELPDSFKIFEINENEIKATVDISAVGIENSVTRNIIIKKENNKWLVEEFAIPRLY